MRCHMVGLQYRYTDGNEHLLISFTDNGNGIPDTDLLILNPFIRKERFDWVYGYAIYYY